jgi:hypothetical protein
MLMKVLINRLPRTAVVARVTSEEVCDEVIYDEAIDNGNIVDDDY